MPSLPDLAIALSRAGLFWPKACLLVVACTGLLFVEHGWVLGTVPIIAFIADVAISRRSWRVVGSWRSTRRRRAMLNSAVNRAARQRALANDLTAMVQAARHAWDVYIADAIIGRTHAVIYDRPPPDVAALERLADVSRRAAELGVDLHNDGPPPAGEEALLPVPQRAAFAPDVLSPTMMNFTAASLEHARAEGGARADRRHRRALDHAAAFGPMMAFAQAVIDALDQEAPVPA